MFLKFILVHSDNLNTIKKLFFTLTSIFYGHAYTGIPPSRFYKLLRQTMNIEQCKIV